MAEISKSPLRRRILTYVGALVALSLMGSALSLYRITDVNGYLDSINRVSVPLGRYITQLQADADVFRRELERSLGSAHWKDPHWKPRPIPRWIEDVLQSEVEKVVELTRTDTDWAAPELKSRWQEWANNVIQGLTRLRVEAGKLHTALEQKDEAQAAQIYPQWISSLEEWRRQLQWGGNEYDRFLRQTFSQAESRVSELRTGLELIAVVVVLFSLYMLWFGERALRPLEELTRLAREITRRGLRKEDKAKLPEIFLSRADEVSQLAKEFHHMATTLLEREKVVETQKDRLQDSNRLLREMGELNENILNSIESVLIVVDLNGKIAQCNPIALRWLGKATQEVIGTDLSSWNKLQIFLQSLPGGAHWLDKMSESPEVWKLEPRSVEDRVYGGQIMPLKQESARAHGAILVLDDLTDDLNLQERLRIAENMAAVGRMSAQVAHEVRNPLHSIGLEAEVAAEAASRLGHPMLKQSLQSILSSVDRLEKITENYLKLSRLSAGEKKAVDLGDVLESVLATYTSVCEASGIKVDWTRISRANLKVWGDADLLEQVFGNLFRNAIQALDGVPRARISWWMGNGETGRVWIKIEDNGPGIPMEVREKLFTPFVTTRAQGTGLGLSFIKKVIEDQGGAIHCMDRPPGQGACFEMVLPAVQEQSLSRSDPPEVVSHGV